MVARSVSSPSKASRSQDQLQLGTVSVVSETCVAGLFGGVLCGRPERFACAIVMQTVARSECR